MVDGQRRRFRAVVSAQVTDSDSLADRWREARPPVAGMHLDSAACSRQSLSVIAAGAHHARYEAEVGGYVAAEAAAPTLDAGRAAFAALAGMPDAEVVFTTGSLNALDLLLGGWPAEHKTVACLPGEYGPNLAMLLAHGFDRQLLPTLGDGRVALDDAALVLQTDPPDFVHLTAVASHTGVVQPVAMIARLCSELGLPLVVDAAQALGQVDCAAGADVTYSTSRKWIAGPRGVGVLAVRPDLMERLSPRLAPPDWAPQSTIAQQLEFGEANIAARVGFSVAIGEHLALGPEAVRARLAELGSISRSVLADVPGWAVVEEAEEPSSITTLAPLDGADPEAVRGWLLAERRILTTYIGVPRAPLELSGPRLRISPHADTTTDDLESFAEALIAATVAVA
jgi:pyridoxal 5-phosphate dependent beta-lyase